jgi:anti-anti-sigma factor
MFQVSKIDVPEKDHVKVVYLAGEVDGDGVESFKEQLSAIIDSTPEVKYYIFHLRRLDFINSMVIGYLADVYSKMAQNGEKMILSEGNAHILDILDLVGFTNLVEHFDALKDAISSTDL